MKWFLITLIPGMAIGWFAVGTDIFDPEDVANTPSSISERISLFGSENDKSSETGSIQILDGFSDAQELLARLNSSSPAELRRWLISLIEGPRVTSDVIATVVRRLASLDPEGTFELVKGTPELSRYINQTLAIWIKSDFTKGLGAAFDHDPTGSFISRAAEELDADDREQLYQVLTERGLESLNPRSLCSLLVSLDGEDYRKSVERVIDYSLQFKKSGYYVMARVLENWFGKDPDGLFEWVSEQSTDPSARSYLIEGLSEAASRIGAPALDRVWDLLDDKERQRFASQFRNSADDVHGVIDWIQERVESPVMHGQMLLKIAGNVWADGRPEMLGEIVSQLGSGFEDRNLARIVEQGSRIWAAQDSEGLRQWLDTIENPTLYTAAERSLLAQWAEDDPLKVIRHWEENGFHIDDTDSVGRLGEPDGVSIMVGDLSLVYSDGYRQVLASLFENIDVFGGEGDPQVLMSLLPEELHEEAVQVYASHIQKDAPEDAIHFLEMQASSEARDKAIQSTVAEWANQAPNDAAEWVIGLAEGPQKDSAVKNVANAWARSDPGSAEKWVMNLPASENRDLAAAQVVKFAGNENVDIAFRLLSTFGDEGLQGELLQQVVAGIVRQDADHAEELIRAAEFAPGLSAKALGVLANEKEFRQVFVD